MAVYVLGIKEMVEFTCTCSCNKDIVISINSCSLHGWSYHIKKCEIYHFGPNSSSIAKKNFNDNKDSLLQIFRPLHLSSKMFMTINKLHDIGRLKICNNSVFVI